MDVHGKSLDQISESVNRVSGAGSFNNNFPVTTSGVELKVGVTPVSGRHTLILVNDSTTPIQFMPTINGAFGTGLTLFSGQMVQIALDPTVTTTWYARTPYYDTTIVLIESKGATD